MTLAGQFANENLAYPLIFLILFLLFKRKSYKTSGIILLQIIILFAFVITHHLSFLILIIYLFLIQLYLYLFNRKANNPVFLNLIILSGVLMLSYYIFVYFGPLETIINSFTNNLVVEGQSVTAPNSWSISIIIQRFTWAVFLVFSVFLFLKEFNKKSLKSVLNSNTSLFLFVGGSLFLFSLFTLLLHASFNWDRISIFGWLLFIPATISMIHELENTNLKKVGLLSLSFILIFGNIYALSISNIDHTDDNKYKGDFKNWVEDQEYNSVLWLINTQNSQGIVIGDEEINRIYLSNSKNFKGNISNLKDDYNEIKEGNVNYVLIRQENYFRILNNFNSVIKYGNISNLNYTSYNENSNLDLIYDNNEVKIFKNNIFN